MRTPGAARMSCARPEMAEPLAANVAALMARAATADLVAKLSALWTDQASKVTTIRVVDERGAYRPRALELACVVGAPFAEYICKLLTSAVAPAFVLPDAGADDRLLGLRTDTRVFDAGGSGDLRSRGMP